MSAHREAGFTLLELLVVLTVLALLMVALFAGLRFATHAWDRSESTGSGADEVRLVQNLLRHEIEQAYPRFLAGATPQDGSVDFSGVADRMTFLAPAPKSFADAARARISLERRPDGRLWQLVMVIRPELAADSEPALVEPLLSGLTDVAFNYAADAANPDWVEDWSHAKALPQLVRVDVTFPRGDSRSWPGVVAAPRISIDADCVYDASTNSCQGR
ncbi:MAG TPA: prepilin-type N-terminal cleavage/methylation domain-containing protein [Rhizomicrobium sp.]|jgi:general secretion pathway protein J